LMRAPWHEAPIARTCDKSARMLSKAPEKRVILNGHWMRSWATGPLASAFVAAVLFALSLPAFLQQIIGTRLSDLPAQFSLQHPSSVYSLLILIPLGVAWLGGNEAVMAWVASIFLSFCVVLKGLLSFHVLASNAKSLLWPALAAVALGLVMPIVNWWNPTSVYLGQFAPTIWHNPTTIVAMPAAILAFLACLRSLKEPAIKTSAATSGVLALGAAIKPAYVIILLLVFLPWFCWKAVHSFRITRPRLALYVAILIAPLLLLVLAQAILVATLRSSWITIAPFAIWSLYSPNPLASLLLSAAFPLSVLGFYRDEIRGNAALALAWMTFAVALVTVILFAEQGSRFAHGNFLWGAYMAIYILFLASAQIVLRHPFTARSWPVLAIFVLHLASGVYFYGRIVTGLGFR
jgi:hypothetical protein